MCRQSEVQTKVNALVAAGQQGQTQLLTEAQNQGAQFFISSQYTSRNRTDSEFVSDLYLAYLQRPGDKLDRESEQMLERAMTKQGLSTRAYDRILKVSRTIADLEGAESVRSPHVAEAVGYRSLDRTYWN